MTRAQFSRDLQDGINAHFGMAYKKHDEEWSQIFEKKTEGKRAYIEQVLRVGLGEAAEKGEGGVIQFDAGAEGWVNRVNFHTFALAFAITEEAIDDNLYADLGEVYGKELAKALQHAKEVRCARIINEAFNANYTGGDGKALCAPDHPLWAGGFYSNKLQTSADLSEEALEDALIQLGGYVNDRNRPIVVKAKKLILPRQQVFRADRILKTDKRVGTNLNDINAIKAGKYLPEDYVVNHYLVDPDAWFIQTDVELGLQYFQRKGVKRGMETDFRTGNMMYKAQERWGAGWTDPRCILGSDGSPI
jgi:hypothetical protein